MNHHKRVIDSWTDCNWKCLPMGQVVAGERCKVVVVAVRSIAELPRNPEASDRGEFAGIGG